MARLSRSQAERAEIRRELIWTLLWSLPRLEGTDLGWARIGDVWNAWLDGRDACGCAFYPDYIEHSRISSDLGKLVEAGRVEARRARPGAHPRWRAIDPEVPNAAA